MVTLGKKSCADCVLDACEENGMVWGTAENVRPVSWTEGDPVFVTHECPEKMRPAWFHGYGGGAIEEFVKCQWWVMGNCAVTRWSNEIENGIGRDRCGDTGRMRQQEMGEITLEGLGPTAVSELCGEFDVDALWPEGHACFTCPSWLGKLAGVCVWCGEGCVD